MTEHLPECWATYPSDPPAWCICDELRACEQRVREDERSNNFTPDDHANGMTGAYQRGLDAARKAVAAELEAGLATSTDGALYFFELSDDPDWPNSGYDVTFHKESLLAAIDALREKP